MARRWITQAFPAVAVLMMLAAPSARGEAPPTPVAGVGVEGGPPPRVAASFPADGSTAPAGVLVLKIVFNQAMTPQGWSFGPTPGAAFPRCLGQPRMLSDQRTFVLLCTVAPRQAYGLEINAAPDFANAHGRSAKPTLLHFATAEAGVFDQHAALAQAGLTDADEPIMTWRDPGKGVSNSPPADPDPADPPTP